MDEELKEENEANVSTFWSETFKDPQLTVLRGNNR